MFVCSDGGRAIAHLGARIEAPAACLSGWVQKIGVCASISVSPSSMVSDGSTRTRFH